MILIKRLLIFIGIAIIPLMIVILLWLLTFQGFNLFSVVHEEYFGIFTFIFIVFGLIMGLALNSKDINEMIS